jgi:hypothetical protein
MWANPDNLKLIKEKRDSERLNETQLKKAVIKQTNPKENILGRLYRSLALDRIFKTSHSTLFYK